MRLSRNQIIIIIVVLFLAAGILAALRFLPVSNKAGMASNNVSGNAQIGIVYPDNVASTDTNMNVTDTSMQTEEPTPSPTPTPEPVYPPKITSMKYDKDAFLVNEDVTLSITIMETDNKTIDRAYYVEMYSSRPTGDYLMSGQDIAIKAGQDSVKFEFKVKFDTPGNIFTLIKIYNKKGGQVLLEKKTTKQRNISYKLTSSKQLEGIDTAAKLTAANCRDLKAAGISFVVRYYSKLAWKVLTKKEAQTISKSGLQLVILYQDRNTHTEDFTYDSGYAQCNEAIKQAKTIGQPSSTPIYFSADFPPSDENINCVKEYFKGVNAAMKAFTASDKAKRFWYIGAFCSYYGTEALAAEGLISWKWESGPWSGDNSSADHAIYQYGRSVKVAGVLTDPNRSNPNNGNNVGGFMVKY